MSADQTRELVFRLIGSTEALAALAAALRLRVSGQEAPPDVQASLEEVVDALGVRKTLDDASPEQLAAMLAPIRSLLLQSVDFLTDPSRAPGWSYTDAELLQSTGRTSAAFAGVVEQVLVPRLDGLGEALARPGAAFLDVGVGVAALAIAMCRTFPHLSVVGIDSWDYPLSLARRNVEDAGFTERIELRQQPAQELADAEAFDLTFVAGPFLPPAVLDDALARVFAATRRGAWVMFGMYQGTSELDSALARLRTARSGGALLRPEEAEARLGRAGFVDVARITENIGMPAMLVVGRRPSH